MEAGASIGGVNLALHTNSEYCSIPQAGPRMLALVQRIFRLVLDGATIVAVVCGAVAILWGAPDFATKAAYTYILVVNAVALTWIAVSQSSAAHRYSRGIEYVHRVNHQVRDYLAARQRGQEPGSLTKAVADILTTISESFSVATLRQCSATIKQLQYAGLDKKDFTVKTFARDTKCDPSRRRTDGDCYLVSDNTDFLSLLDGTEKNRDSFFCNNLPGLYPEYKNSSFKVCGDPEVAFSIEAPFIGSVKIMRKWPLAYKSTIVVPIRHISVNGWGRFDEIANADDDAEVPRYIGFLCIDCPSRRVFHNEYACEMMYAYADVLYALFSELPISPDSGSTATMSDQVHGNGDDKTHP